MTSSSSSSSSFAYLNIQKCRQKTATTELELGSKKTKNCCLKFASSKSILHLLIAALILSISPVTSLTSEERGELARKFKYYHKSVRPSEQFNMVETVNGTFFRLLTQLELSETREMEMNAQLSLDFSLFVHFRDDRLQLRDLQEMPIPIPDEFQAWQPRIQMFPIGTTRTVQMQRTTNLSPKNGQITIVQRFSGQIHCDFDQWKMPFEQYECQFWLETDPDERLHLTVVRDLRPNGQLFKIHFEYEQWPWLLLRFQFRSGQWQSALVAAYLPSLLLLCCALLAQWKRRKIQVVISLGAILAVILIQYRQQRHSGAINLLDLWLAAIFVHLICLLSADLLLPARRMLIFKRTTNGAEPGINGRNERRQQGRAYGRISPPTISQRKLTGKNGFSPREGGGIIQSRPIRATFYPSSGSLHHHYVSSPQLGHSRQVQQGRRMASRLPAAPTSPAQMIRTYSVPPRRLDDVRRELGEPPSALVGGSVPLSRKRTAPAEVGVESDERERAIASLLSEMEGIRRAESTALGPSSNSRMRHGASSEDDLGPSGPSELAALRMSLQARPPPSPPPPLPPIGHFPGCPPPPQAYHHHHHHHYGGESSGELGRMQAAGIPRRKQIVLYAILTSFCLFLCSYALLLLSALFDWL